MRPAAGWSTSTRKPLAVKCSSATTSAVVCTAVTGHWLASAAAIASALVRSSSHGYSTASVASGTSGSNSHVGVPYSSSRVGSCRVASMRGTQVGIVMTWT